MTPPAEGRPRRRRRLSDEERRLWKGVAQSVKPMHRAALPEQEAAAPEPIVPPAPPRKAKASPMAVPAAPAPAALQRPKPPVLEPIGRREKKRIASGRESIDARIDLHGRTQAEAYDALIGFIRRCRSQGARTVLVITGKGRAEIDGDGRGVLKRQVPMWLGLPELRECVVGFESAAAGHGGAGALYVRLRRSRGAEP